MSTDKPVAYAVCGSTADGSRLIHCYFEELSRAAEYLKDTQRWQWECKLYKVMYKEYDGSKV